jgi:hypothetical protein
MFKNDFLISGSNRALSGSEISAYHQTAMQRVCWN